MSAEFVKQVSPPSTHTDSFTHGTEGKREVGSGHSLLCQKTQEVTPEKEAVFMLLHSEVVVKDRFAIVHTTLVLSIFSPV